MPCLFLFVFLVHIALGAMVPLSVTTTQACESVMVGSTHLTCEETTTQVTIVDFLVSAGVDTTNSFSLSIISVPPNSATQQTGTTTQCTQKTPQGRCLAIQQTTMRVDISKPVLFFDLEPVGLNFQVPYTYLYKSAISPSVSPSDNCIFVGTAISENVALMNKIQNNNGTFACTPSYPVSFNPPGSSMLTYTMSLDKFFSKSVQYAASFLSVQPNCMVMKARGRGRVAADVTLTITNEETGQSEQIFVAASDFNQAKVSVPGQVLLRQLGLRSLSEFTNPIDYGLWLVCNNASSLGPDIIEPISMIPVGWNPIDNPWNQLSEEDRMFAMPTPENILKLNGMSTNPTADAYSRAFYVYINNTVAPAYCTGCGCYGVNPNIYSDAPQELYLENYLNIFSKDPVIPCNQILNVTNINTCVPGFGSTFLGLNPPSPCEALNYYAQRNAGTAAQRQQKYVAEGNRTLYTSPLTNSQWPNSWIVENRVYYDLPELVGAQFEYTVYFTGNLSAVINPSGFASAAFDLDFTYCSADISAQNNGAFVAARICNTATSGGSGRFVLYTTCDPATPLVPQFPGRIVLPQPLATGQCTTVQQLLTVTGNLAIGGNYFCTVQIASADATPSFSANTSLILDEKVLGCVAGNTTAIAMAYLNVFQFDPAFEKAQNTSYTDDVDTTAGYITIAIVAAVLIGLALLLAIIYFVARFCLYSA